MTTVITRPEFVTEEHLAYLDTLNESGEVSMYGTISFIEDTFPEISRGESLKLLTYWIKTFDIRQWIIQENEHVSQS